MNNIEFLVSLLNEVDRNWRPSLLEVLQSPDVEEVHGNPQINRASFILQRARMRQCNSLKLGLETFGLPDLILTLAKLPAHQQLRSYGVKTTMFIGSCFVLDDRMLGCEFVKRGISKTVPFNG
jgi:hypothetical protein